MGANRADLNAFNDGQHELGAGSGHELDRHIMPGPTAAGVETEWHRQQCGPGDGKSGV